MKDYTAKQKREVSSAEIEAITRRAAEEDTFSRRWNAQAMLLDTESTNGAGITAYRSPAYLTETRHTQDEYPRKVLVTAL